MAVLAAILAALAGAEWARLCKLKFAWLYGVLVTALYAVILHMSWEEAAFVAAGVFWVAVVPAWLWRGVSERHVRALIPAGFLVIVPPALAMALLRPQELLGVLLLVWVADSAAYFVGRAFGRRKLAPSISPGKTWEGAAGGVGGALAYAIIYATLIEGTSWVPYLAAAALLAVLSIVGDLFESAAKRQAGVKDSGTLLPGHGGILDRIDSAASTLPLAALLFPLIKANL